MRQKYAFFDYSAFPHTIQSENGVVPNRIIPFSMNSPETGKAGNIIIVFKKPKCIGTKRISFHFYSSISIWNDFPIDSDEFFFRTYSPLEFITFKCDQCRHSRHLILTVFTVIRSWTAWHNCCCPAYIRSNEMHWFQLNHPINDSSIYWNRHSTGFQFNSFPEYDCSIFILHCNVTVYRNRLWSQHWPYEWW